MKVIAPRGLGAEYVELKDDVLLTPEQVASWLQISPRQVRRLAIPFANLGPRIRRYTAGAVRAFLKAQTSHAA